MSDCTSCCDGIEIAVPVSEVNPPGLTALSYRVGTYPTFYETMLARLSNLVLDIPAASGDGESQVMPLAGLTTRDLSDPSIALLDAWAIVADVLTFYQERIANEGYLATAVERRSLIELARLIGYRPRPGVSASVYLAFTVTTGFTGMLPAGTRAQSIPGTGQSPQFFETSSPLAVRDSWNALSPRLTRPQLITPKATGKPAVKDGPGIPLVTGADVIDSVYFDGVATNLSPGDKLLFVFGPSTDSTEPVLQYMRAVANVDAQAALGRTAVTLGLQWTPGLAAADELQLYVDKAGFLFPGSDIAAQVVAVLRPTIENLRGAGFSTAEAAALLQAPRSRIALLQGVAVQRGFTRVAAWLATLLQAMQWASLSNTATFGAANVGRLGPLAPLPAPGPTSPLFGLDEIMGRLAQAPSRPPANALRLARSVANSFATQADTAPRLLAALRPAAAAGIYPAWSALATPASRVDIYAARAKAALFAANWSGPATVTNSTATPTSLATVSTITTSFTDPSISSAWATAVPGLANAAGIAELPLDNVYDKIMPGSWIAIERPAAPTAANAPTDRIVTFHIVASLRSGNVAAPGFAAKVSLLTLQPPWLTDTDGAANYQAYIGSAAVLRGTVIYAQSEALAVTEEPLDTDIESDALDLAGVYAAIEPGRWVIVSGNRTDIPNVSGVAASELAMVAGVSQGAQEPLCIPFPFSTPPFSEVYYTTEADAYGDRLVVGKLAQTELLGAIRKLPPPSPLNQQYCNQVELAPGVYGNAYIPTDAEKAGQYPSFTGLLVDPVTRRPLNPKQVELMQEQGDFAWRVSSQKLHTILTLSTPLSYSYDRATVTIYANVTDATHGQSTGEVLGNGDATKPYQSFALSQWPLTWVSAPTAAGATSTLTVRVNDLQWNERDDLAEAGPRDRVFITYETEAQKTNVTFGSGKRGARVPTGTANVKATYRYGIGSAGNAAAAQISQLATHPLGAQGVTNPLPATGGVDPDTIGQTRANAPVSVIALDRLVSVSDYADFCLSYAGIGKAAAIRLTDGRQLLVHVTITGGNASPIDTGSDLYNNLLSSLQSYGDPYLPVQVAISRIRLVVMAASVGLQTGYAWEDVAPKLRGKILALFAFDARGLGQAAFQSEAVEVMQAVTGVAWVNITTFDSVPDSVSAAQLAALAATLGARPAIASQRAYVNPRAAPGSSRRIVPAELVFMTPDIPDTLILTPAGQPS